MIMNQNTLFQLLSVGMGAFSLLTVIWVLYKRLVAVEKREADLLLEWHAWAASKVSDYPTSRVMASMKKKPSDVLMTDVPIMGIPKRKPSPHDLTLEQSG